MGLPPVADVTSRFRFLAYAILGIWVLAMATSLGLSLRKIWVNRENPPTVLEVLDVRSTDSWGAMPTFLITLYRGGKCGRMPHEAANLGSGPGAPLYSAYWKNSFHKRDNSSLDPFSYSRGKMIVVNASMLIPNFSFPIKGYGVEVGTPIFGFAIPYKACNGVFMHTATSSLHREDLNVTTEHPQQRYSRNALDVSTYYTDSRTQFHMEVAFKTNGAVHVFNLEKQYVPKRGVFWGWPWQDDHVKEEYVLTGPTTHGSKSTQIFWIQVLQKTINYVRPISMIQQIRQVVLNVGASVALLSAVFYTIFKFKYPRTAEENESSELTLLGFGEYRRMEVEKWRAEHYGS